MIHPIPTAALDQHIAILGKTRAGKSSVMRVLVEGLLDAGKPVCIVDPKGDWWGLKSSADGKKAGYPVVIFGGEHADVPLNEHSGAHVAELVATGNRPCIIDLGGWMPGGRTRFWVAFASTLFRLTKGLRWLAIDEVHNFAPKGKVMDPDSGKALHWANRLASEGLGKGVHMIIASQRPQKVHNDTLTSCETLIAMRVLHPSDRGAVTDWIKGCGDAELGAKVLDTLADMARGEGWVWSPEIKFGPKRIKFPMFETYDSFKAQPGEAVEKLKGWATVDLEEVKTKLKAVVEEAQANDPKALKAEIATLKRQMTQAVRQEILPDPKTIETARAQGRAEGERAAAESFLATMRDRYQLVGTVVQKVQGDLADMANAFGKEVQPPKLTYKSAPRAAVTPPHVASIPRETAASSTPKTNGAHHRVEGISGPQQKILDALAWWQAMGHEQPTRTQVAVKAGMKCSGGHFKTRLSELHGQGLIRYVGADNMAMTTEGGAVAGTPDLRSTVVDTVRPLLSGPQLKIFDTIIQGATQRADVAAGAGMDPSGGHFKTRLSELSTFGILTYPDRDSVALADWVRA